MYAEQNVGTDNSKVLGVSAPVEPDIASAQPPATGVPAASSIPQNNHSHTALIAAVAVVMVVAIAAAIYLYNNNFVHTTNSNRYYINLSTADSFISNYSLPANISTLHRIDTPYTNFDPYCQTTEYILDYLPAGVFNAAEPINFSALNQSNPVAILVGIEVVNSSYLSQYNTTVKSNNGYCLPIMKQISENSTFVSVPTKFYNTNGYIIEISNFTNEGLNLTSTYYIGPRPNLTWYNADAHYHNAIIGLAIWTIAGHENMTMLYKYMNYTVRAFENYASK